MRKSDIQEINLETNINTNEGRIIPNFVRKYKQVEGITIERIPLENEKYFKKVLLRIKFCTESFIIHKDEQNRSHKAMNTIEEVNKFLENKGPTYSVRNMGPEKMSLDLKKEFNHFLIRIRNAENPHLTLREKKEIPNKLIVPFENRRAFLPEEIGYIKEGKLCEAYNSMSNAINIAMKKDMFLRKHENMKITQMCKVLKNLNYILVTTDKTKRTMAISKDEYVEAGIAFLSNKKHYTLLEKDSSDKIENQANKLIKRM